MKVLVAGPKGKRIRVGSAFPQEDSEIGPSRSGEPWKCFAKSSTAWM